MEWIHPNSNGECPGGCPCKEAQRPKAWLCWVNTAQEVDDRTISIGEILDLAKFVDLEGTFASVATSIPTSKAILPNMACNLESNALLKPHIPDHS